MSELSGLPIEPPPGEWWERKVQELDVSFPERTIELVVMPYEEETIVEHPQRPGVAVVEVCSRGAYDGIERRANRVKVNRDHRDDRIVGRALTLHPSRTEGLVGKLRIANTPLGDETLELAADECLDASAGFRPINPGGVRWETRSRCRLLKCFLGHIALVGEGAYPSAKVLAVRAAAAPPAERPATPNLDLVRAWRLTERYDSLSR
jgi:HK97 family phage prohead protease